MGSADRWKIDLPSREQQFAMKRRAVLREAARAFHHNGFHSTSLDDIARELNVTKAALYHYVRSKHEILYECHAAALDLGDAAIAAANAKGGSGLDKVLVLSRKLMEFLMGELGELALLTEVEALTPAHRKVIQARRDQFDRALRGFLKEGVADGSIAPCDEKVAGFWLMGAINWIPKWYSTVGPKPAAELIEHFIHHIQRGLGGVSGREEHTRSKGGGVSKHARLLERPSRRAN